MTPDSDNAPEAPAWLVGRELSPGEIDAALEYLNHRKNGGTSPVRNEAGKVDPAELAARIRKAMPY